MDSSNINQGAFSDFKAIRVALEGIHAELQKLNGTAVTCSQVVMDTAVSIAADIRRVADRLCNGRAVDLDIVLGSGSSKPTKGSGTVANNKRGTGAPVKCKMTQGMQQKGTAAVKGAVQNPITLTTVPSSITLQPVDASNNPVQIAPGDTVNGTLTSDSASFTVAPGADSLHYTATIPANTPQGTVVNLSATLNGTIQGAPANLSASVQLTLNIPPVPTAVDLEIVIGS